MKILYKILSYIVNNQGLAYKQGYPSDNCTHCVAENFCQEKAFTNFVTSSHWQNIYLFGVNDMVTLYHIGKTNSVKCFCSAKVA